MIDERLLLPATRALVEGWCGPVVVRGLSAFHDGPAVLLGHDTREPSARAGDWLVYLLRDVEDGCEVASVSPDEIRLDLSRAECRDRVARVVAERVGLLRDGAKPACTAPDFTTRFDLPHWTLAGPQFGNGGGGPSLTWIPHKGFCEGLADLDPLDDTRLPDGSRLVDALALALVARQVLGVDRE